MKKFIKQIQGKLMLAAAVMIGAAFASHVLAQPYITNSSPQAGAYQYNQNWAQPLQPSVTLSRQSQAGILAGTIAPAPWFLLTNSFSTNLYTTTPVITANASSPSTGTNFVTVVSVTTTNFVLQTGVTNQTIYWSAIGH
jgi:hypothetical protein